MSVTVRDLLHNDVFRQCSPIVAGGELGLDEPVRWVYTHERYDVTQFLSGGELLLIEGSVLASHACERGLRTYMESLAAADVRGLAVELLDYFTEIPETLALCGDELGIPVIGLRSRQPFVRLCQKSNTQIMKEQLLAHMKMDNLSTELNARFAKANCLSDIATALYATLGEHVLIISPQGEVVAAAGTSTTLQQDATECAHSPYDILPIRKDGFLIANVIISNTLTNIDAQTKRRVCATLSDAIAPFMPMDTRSKILAKLFEERDAGAAIPSPALEDARSMLHALGYLADVHCSPFLISLRSWNDGAGLLQKMLEVLSDALPQGKVSLIYEVEESSIVGSYICDDPTWFASLNDFTNDRFRALPLGESAAVIAGSSVVGARGLLEAIRSMRFTASHSHNGWGRITTTTESAFAHMLSFAHTDDAIHSFINEYTAILGNDPTSIDTLCSLFDCMGNKTSACERLGIQRQTLYNRLDRITQATGIPQHDTDSWSLLAMAAKFVKQLPRQPR